MAAILELPERGSTNYEKNLSDAIETLLGPAIIERNAQQIGWWITDAYLQGMRSFDIIDFRTGVLNVSYEEEDGDIHMRWEEVLTRTQTEIGRLTRLDLSPVVTKRPHSLESLRNSSLAQVLLSQQDSLTETDAFDLAFITCVVQYGTYGRAAWRDETSSNPLAIVKELIPSWELLSMPAGVSNPTDPRVLCRTRLYPLRQLQKRKGIRLPADDRLLDIVKLPYGTNVTQSVSGAGLPTSGGGGTMADLFDEIPGQTGITQAQQERRRQKLVPIGATEEPFVRLRELWVYGPRGNTCARYIARAGRAIVEDINYLEKDQQVPLPIGVARYQDIGHFYGRSFPGRVIPFALELENLLEHQIVNAADMDRFGFTMVPMDRGIDFDGFRADESPRVIGYQEDATRPGESGVEQLLPATATDVPGRIFQWGVELLDRSTAQGPLLSGVASKRADSGEAFNVLAQMGATHLRPTARSVKNACVTNWRFQLHEIRQRFAEGTGIETIPLTKIDNSLAGITIDTKTGQVVLKADQLPDAFELSLTIASEDPLAADRERQEAAQFLAQFNGQLPTPLEFIIQNYRKGWNFPIGQRAVWENYVRAVLLNLIMFNDGETLGELPGQNLPAGIIGTYFHPAADKPEVHLLAVEEFIAGPEFSLASTAVQNAFNQRWEYLKQRLGEPVPGIRPIDEAALENAARRQPAIAQGATPNAP